ncbi:unnamed protein product [Trichobilharzia szidati]|nr:unnamed protein product [Trichobilharzia szidati]
MSEMSIRVQTYLVLGVMIACFSILYPKIFHPMLMHTLGLTKSKNKEEQINFENFGPNGHLPPRPPIRPTEGTVHQDQGKRGGIMSIVLPVYAIGIILYLVYTLSKVFSSKRRKNSNKKEEFLRHYYRDFHYDVDRGKFRMGCDSSDDDDDDGDSDGKTNPFQTLDFSSSRKSATDSKNKPFEWGSVFKDTSYPDIYRSARSLPKDLGKLLMRMERQDLDTEELSHLRIRLEQTEREMTRILKAMQSAEDALRGPMEEPEIEEENYADVLADENISSEKQYSAVDDENEDIGSVEEEDGNISGEDEVEFNSRNEQPTEDVQKSPEEQDTFTNDNEIDIVDISESCIRRRLIPSSASS